MPAAEEGFDDAVGRYGELEKRARSRVAGTMALVMVGVPALVMAAFAATTGSWLALVPIVAFFAPIAIILVAVRVGVVPISPLWYADRHANRDVMRSMIAGRAVRDPDNAGLAVTTSAYLRRYWWAAMSPAALGIGSLLVHHHPIRWVIAAPLLAMSGAWFVALVRRRSADQANRRILACER